MPHISVKDLKIIYGDHKALKDITVDIPDGQITAIIGPSGCGKTTFLKSLNRLIDLCDDVTVDGQVLIDGENIYDPNADVLSLRKKVGFLSQRPFPLPMSIYDNITFGPRIHKMNGEQLAQQIKGLETNGSVNGFSPNELHHVGNGQPKNGQMTMLVETYLRLAGLWDELKDRLHAPAAKLSVGQQQRLALARALAVEPKVILADEPTSALDPISARLIEQQFQLLKKRYTIVVVTHILRQARRIADYVLFFYLGELVEHGPAEQFFHSPKNEKTKAYIAGEIS